MKIRRTSWFAKPVTAAVLGTAFIGLGLSMHPVWAKGKTVQSKPAVERRVQGNLVIEGVPDVPQSLTERMGQYLSTRSATCWDWDPSGLGMYIFTRFGDTTQVHKIESPMGARQQITFFKEPINAATVNPVPEKNSFLFLKDVGGDENYQIYLFHTDTGRFKLLTDGKSRYGSPCWANDGMLFAYTSTERNGKDRDLWISNAEHPEYACPLYAGGGWWTIFGWSIDDSQILAEQYNSITDSSLFVIDTATGKAHPVGQSLSGKKISVGEARFSADGKGVFYTSDEDSEFHHLYYQDLASGERRALSKDINWDVEDIAVSANGRMVAFSTNEDGINMCYVIDLESSKLTRYFVEGLPVGIFTGMVFSPDSSSLAVSVNGSTSPGDVYEVICNPTKRDVLDDARLQRIVAYKRSVGQVVRWTASEVGGLNAEKFTDPDLIYYESFDRDLGQPRKIPAFIYRPDVSDGYQAPYPVLVSIHGGPESQFQPHFYSLIQYLVNEMGVCVVCPNVRGSSGYGKTYVDLDNGFKREDSIRDIGALLDWLKLDPDLDESRVVVMGGSYGGFMTLSALTHYSDRLCGGIDNVGISNLVTFLKNTQDYRRDLRRAEYGDERDPKMYEYMESIAPANNAHKIKVPLLVVQGQNDPRVPVSEAEQMVNVVRKNGGDVWYIKATDEGHGFRKKANRDFYMESVVLFLQKYLLKQEN